jgi:hypothetical protein
MTTQLVLDAVEHAIWTRGRHGVADLGGVIHHTDADTGTGEHVGAPLTGHTSYVTSVAFSPDGKRIVRGNFNGALRLWPTFPVPASAMCAKAQHQHERPAVARMGLTRHRLHQGLSRHAGRAGLASR